MLSFELYWLEVDVFSKCRNFFVNDFLVGCSLEAEEKVEVLADGQVAEENVKLRAQPQAAACLFGVVDNVMAVDSDGSRRWCVHACHNGHACCLAGTVVACKHNVA